MIEKFLLKCFAGCSTSDIIESIELTMSDLFINLGEETEMTALAPKKDVEKGRKYNSIDEIKNEFKTLEDAHELF